MKSQLILKEFIKLELEEEEEEIIIKKKEEMIKIRKELETVMITRIAREGAKIIIEIIIKD